MIAGVLQLVDADTDEDDGDHDGERDDCTAE
jgi:hypothetical protein